MNKVFILSALLSVFALSACKIGEIDPTREHLYGKSEFQKICEDEPHLCNDDSETW